jgi:hypothetical protein
MANKAYIWNAATSTWVEILSNAAPTTYYLASAPANPNEGDIWVDSDDEILSATGPQGAAGAAGANGTNGTTGATGANGTNGVGVPVGGSTGQVLSKIDATNYNTQWTTPSAGSASLIITRNLQSASYPLVTGDLDKLVEMNVATANTVTVGTALNSMAEGSQIHLLQISAGQTTVVASGVTVNGTPGLKLRAQWSSATLIKRSAAAAAGVWVLIGDLST